jgi:GrpB-like predicted nucleotidyltransferase (UPF0157 family)
MPKIEIMVAKPEWQAQFVTVAEPIRLLSPAGSLIHHIGSTAVPGLAAKDVIDIQLSLEDFDDVPVGGIVNLGYSNVPDAHDHTPPGVELPALELQKLFFSFSSPRVHLHVRQIGRFNQKYPLLCRDFLRSNPNATAAYEAVKQELAIRFPDDVEAYYAVKDPVFDIIMAGAEEWAQRTGWTQPPSDM